MKLPNGYGAITKLKGRRRRPYMIRIKGSPIGYTATRQEALDLLHEYHKDPVRFNRKETTFSEVYDLLVKYKSSVFSDKTMSLYKGKYKKCSELYNIPYADLRTYHFSMIIDEKEETHGAKQNMKKFFRAMDKVAYEYDIIIKQYTEALPAYTADSTVVRKPFTETEIKTLWKNQEIEDADLVLILIYTGMRISELTDLKLENIDIKNQVMIGGSKTKAGRNREIPIHSKIIPFIENRMNQAESDTLLNYSSKTLRVRFHKVMEKLKMSHIPHECRHTMRTRLDNININPNIINSILGHQGPGVGERVYTHKSLADKIKAVEQLD